jgi:hypothetical protein
MSEDIQYTLKYKIKEDSTDFKVGDLVVGKDKYQSYIDSNSVEINKSIFLKGKEIQEKQHQSKAKEESKINLDNDISVIIEIPRKSRIFTTNNNYKVRNIYTKQENKYGPENIIKLVLESELTPPILIGGKRKTIRRKSKNRKTKKKINGGVTGRKYESYEDPNYSNDAEERKRNNNFFKEIDQMNANRENQKKTDNEWDELQKKKILNNKLKRNPNQIVPRIGRR